MVACPRFVMVAAMNGRRSSTKPPYKDHLKYVLLNILQPSMDAQVHVQRRLQMYKDTHFLVKLNNASPIKADNLYALLYSRYFTTRAMLRDAPFPVESDDLEDDDELKMKFKVLVQMSFASRNDFENAYLGILREFKHPDTFGLYSLLTTRMLSSSAYESSADKEMACEGPLTQVSFASSTWLPPRRTFLSTRS